MSAEIDPRRLSDKWWRLSWWHRLTHRCKDFDPIETQLVFHRHNLNRTIAAIQLRCGMIDRHSLVKCRCRVCGRTQLKNFVETVRACTE